jgi:hypothetical protein
MGMDRVPVPRPARGVQCHVARVTHEQFQTAHPKGYS